ncbi:MAG TPA: isoaspartyl peptidase/L-asparaginase, partial [Rhodanobacter sp.]
PIARAAAEVINQDIPAMGGSGGAIALDDQGHIAIPFNTHGMFRGWIDASGVPHVAIYGDEDDGSSAPPAPAASTDDAGDEP